MQGIGDQNGSHLDDLTGLAHPLSWFEANMGSASLRGQGLYLAKEAAPHLSIKSGSEIKQSVC
ncbi:hypothetical protein GCM10009677_29130 [Sphaerisporangium rubeum]|uniref:Uncharacterized protein n=1 Tax=Sphaerisporangium rubeum TaxID=321317 RepID=A0A7X0IBH5_9ACTN|nr:hypothetical protein [Sphaerisporangium rubeum]